MADHAADRGRSAETPRDIPAAGWKDIAWRVKDQAAKDNLSIVAGGVAFYLLLALPPALAAIVSVYGLVADPATVQSQVAGIGAMLPPDARQLITDQMSAVAGASGGALGFGVAFAILLALWSAAKGMKAMMTALDIAYDEEESRGFVRLNLVALGLTLGLIVYLILALTLVAAVPAVLALASPPDWLRWVVQLARWPLLFVLAVVALAVVYRYAPDRDQPRWNWASPGALVGTALWLLGSIAFSVYVSNFGDYNRTYGAISAVVVLMLWLFIAAYAVLIGAEVNAETERQTRRDTTRGDAKPMGRRQAHAADTVGRSQD